jgi:hypothetical protein
MLQQQGTLKKGNFSLLGSTRWLVRDHRGLSTAYDVLTALTSEVRLPIRTAACPLIAEPCG